ncbi:hypothetical protein BDW72DRAFT_173411 [Aspergillus terricola var. indicus]
MAGEQEIQSVPVLRCGLCNKPFDKQSTLKRHGYYCRSRRAGPTARSRSCISCARRKARCDNRWPKCSRCVAKDVECQYPATVSLRSKGVRSGTSIDRSPVSLTGSPPSARLEQENDGRTGTLAEADSSLGVVLNLAEAEGDGLHNWVTYDNNLEFNFADLEFDTLDPIPQANRTPDYHGPLAAKVQARDPLISIPPPLALPRLLTRRPESITGGKQTTHLILQTLKSYLHMMLQEHILPPFIHTRSVPQSFSVNSQAAPEYSSIGPLEACLNILDTIKNSKSRRSFWNHVRTQCEQLCSEQHQQLSRWELLGAMQALGIYILVRVGEGETEENNIDFSLLAGVTVLAQRLSGINALNDLDSPLHSDDHGPDVNWNEWIFEESRRRLSIIFRIVSMLTYFQPAARCDLPTDLALAPLPAKKPLWEANDWIEWKTELQKEPRIQQTAFGLAATGELVRLDKAHGRSGPISHLALDAETVSRSAASWEEWCSGMDGFGALVMLAASSVV